VDSTILTALSLIATKQAQPTQKTMDKIKQLLDYCASQEEAIITYHASKMILAVNSNAGYCNERNPAAELVDTFSYRTTLISPPTMEQS
jgi:hypothetical protein